MSAFQYLSVLICVCGLAVGNVLLKKAAITVDPALGQVMGLLANPWLYVALAVYGVMTLFWVMLLKKVPLSLAYPMFALGFVLVPLLDHWFFKTELRASTFLSGVVILVGVVIGTRGI